MDMEGYYAYFRIPREGTRIPKGWRIVKNDRYPVIGNAYVTVLIKYAGKGKPECLPHPNFSELAESEF